MHARPSAKQLYDIGRLNELAFLLTTLPSHYTSGTMASKFLERNFYIVNGLSPGVSVVCLF